MTDTPGIHKEMMQVPNTRNGRIALEARRKSAAARQAERDARTAAEQMQVLAARGVNLDSHGKELVKLRREVDDMPKDKS